MGLSLNQKCWDAGASPEKLNKALEGSGGQVQREAAEETEVVYPVEKETDKRLFNSLQPRERRL